MNIVRSSAPLLLHRIAAAASPVELVYNSHPRWPLPVSGDLNRPLRISVLDSSFNPPTLAHLALANTRRPRQGASDSRDYDAKLLLLSIKNADKTLKPEDATYLQRLEMMYLLSNHVDTSASHPRDEPSNVAIAIINEPTFVGKSHLLLDFLDRRVETLVPGTETSDRPILEMSFLLGMDTLERVFAPRYYPSNEPMMDSLRHFFKPAPYGDDSRIVCARRGTVPFDDDVPLTAKEFVDSGRISIVDLVDDLSTYSSTAVRRSVGSDADDSWRSLVLADVADYIVTERLYASERRMS